MGPKEFFRSKIIFSSEFDCLACFISKFINFGSKIVISSQQGLLGGRGGWQNIDDHPPFPPESPC